MANRSIPGRFPSALVVGVALTLGLLGLAGCGDDDDQDASSTSQRRSTTTEPSTTEQRTTSETAEDPATSTTGTAEPGNAVEDPAPTSPTTPPDPAPTTASPTTTAPTTVARPPSTTAPVTEGVESPTAAATALMEAWANADRQQALRIAEPAAVDALFSRPALADTGHSRCRQDGAAWACPVLDGAAPFVIRVEGGEASYRVVAIASFDD